MYGTLTGARPAEPPRQDIGTPRERAAAYLGPAAGAPGEDELAKILTLPAKRTRAG
jgi:hypothetical protein